MRFQSENKKRCLLLPRSFEYEEIMRLKDAVTTAGQETSEATTASCLQPAATHTLSRARERRQSGGRGAGAEAEAGL